MPLGAFSLAEVDDVLDGSSDVVAVVAGFVSTSVVSESAVAGLFGVESIAIGVAELFALEGGGESAPHPVSISPITTVATP